MNTKIFFGITQEIECGGCVGDQFLILSYSITKYSWKTLENIHTIGFCNKTIRHDHHYLLEPATPPLARVFNVLGKQNFAFSETSL